MVAFPRVRGALKQGLSDLLRSGGSEIVEISEKTGKSITLDQLLGLESEMESDSERIRREEQQTGVVKLRNPMPLSEFSQRAICYDVGARISFAYRPWLKRIYDIEHTQIRTKDGELKPPRRKILMKCARQTEKSTQLGNKSLSLCALIPNFTMLYVSSGMLNTLEFGDERIDNPIRISPVLQRMLRQQKGMVDNKLTKRFANNSRVVLRAAGLNAKRVRGIPADGIAIDEIQDFLPELIPVITATSNNSDIDWGPLLYLSGTPLSFDNYIERVFSRDSTQGMWLTKCTRCNHWNEPGPQQVSKDGMCCSKCGKLLNPLLGRWVQMRSSDDVSFEGFWLSRVMMPYTKIAKPEIFELKWRNFYEDVTNPNTSEAQIMNEHFGLSYDSGKKPITRDQLIAACDQSLSMHRYLPPRVVNDPDWPVFAGIDWGEGSEGGAYTVIHLGYMAEVEGRVSFEVFYAKRYEGPEAEPEFVKDDIAELLTANNVQLAFADTGHGWGMIDSVRERIEDGLNRVIGVSYSGTMSGVLHWDDKSNELRVHRTRWMSKIFNLLKRGEIRLPRWSEYSEPFGDDIQNISVDKSPKLRQMVYTHVGTDDSFHSLLLSKTAAMFYYQELDEFANA